MEGKRMALTAGRRILNKELCDKLVQSASLTINCNVLITDEQGYVISSNDLEREGTLHEASLEVVRSQHKIYHDSSAAMRLVGTMPGMTIPLFLEETVIGTIGITGSPQEISRYGALIQQMAQVFLAFYSQQQTTAQMDYRKLRLIREIITFDKRTHQPEGVYNIAYEMGIDLNLPRAVILVKNTAEGGENPGGEEPNLISNRLREKLAGWFPGEQDIICPMNDTEFAVLACLPEGKSEERVEKLLETCQSLAKEAEEESLRLQIGIGAPVDSLDGLRRSYEDAAFVVRILQIRRLSAGCLSVDALSLEKLACYLPEELCQEMETGLYQKIFSAKKRDEVLETVYHWCQQKFHFTDTAQALHIHKSTLAYRFRRIQEIYGLDLYDFDRVMALYLLHIRRSLR